MPVIPVLIFLRHSLPAIDPATPAREWHLSEEGRQRCRKLASQLADFNPQRIISSVEPKALETAQIVAETLGLPYESAAGLHEHVRSRAEQASQGIFEASLKAFFEQSDRLVYGDETADQAHVRFVRALDAVRDEYPDLSPLVIITHGTVISLFVARACSVDPFLIWKSLKLPCMVIFSAHSPKIISLESPVPQSLVP